MDKMINMQQERLVSLLEQHTQAEGSVGDTNDFAIDSHKHCQ